MDDDLRNSHVNAGMFVSAMRHAIGRDDIRTAYEADTGRKVYAPPRSNLDRMIDEETGAALTGIRQFAEWFRDTHWGAGEAPDLDRVFEAPDKATPAD